MEFLDSNSHDYRRSDLVCVVLLGLLRNLSLLSQVPVDHGSIVMQENIMICIYQPRKRDYESYQAALMNKRINRSDRALFSKTRKCSIRPIYAKNGGAYLASRQLAWHDL